MARLLRLECAFGQATEKDKKQALAALSDEQLEQLEAGGATGRRLQSAAGNAAPRETEPRLDGDAAKCYSSK